MALGVGFQVLEITLPPAAVIVDREIRALAVQNFGGIQDVLAGPGLGRALVLVLGVEAGSKDHTQPPVGCRGFPRQCGRHEKHGRENLEQILRVAVAVPVVLHERQWLACDNPHGAVIDSRLNSLDDSQIRMQLAS